MKVDQIALQNNLFYCWQCIIYDNYKYVLHIFFTSICIISIHFNSLVQERNNST